MSIHVRVFFVKYFLDYKGCTNIHLELGTSSLNRQPFLFSVTFLSGTQAKDNEVPYILYILNASVMSFEFSKFYVAINTLKPYKVTGFTKHLTFN